MQKYMNKGIKEVIGEFPEVGVVLEKFGVGCVTCNVGTCLLKDIIGIHNLAKNEEIILMAKIEKIIYPDREIKVELLIEEENKRSSVPVEYSKPVKQLVDEHTMIKVLLENIPKICEIISRPSGFDDELVLQCVEFIKNYADKFHHSKEEDILFKYVDPNSDVIKAMLEDHKIARWFVKSVLRGIEKQDVEMIAENLTSYGELLAQHIKKEDEILYPFIDRNITMSQVDELNEKFKLVNSETGSDFNEKWTVFLDKVKELS